MAVVNGWRKSSTAITQECCEQYWTSPGGNTPQSTNYTATYLPSRKLRQTRHAGHCWRSRDELISDVLLWTPTYCRAKPGRLARTYIQQLCADTGCSPEDLPEAMNDREKWWERVRDIRVGGTTWWWWILRPSTYEGVVSRIRLTSVSAVNTCSLKMRTQVGMNRWCSPAQKPSDFYLRAGKRHLTLGRPQILYI